MNWSQLYVSYIKCNNTFVWGGGGVNLICHTIIDISMKGAC